jgi:hypothetical protein
MGERLVEAWARGTGQANPLRTSGASWISEIDEALTPLLGRGASRTNPNGVWERLHACLHPSGMTQPEAVVIKGLLRDADAQRERIFAFIEQSPVRSDEAGEPTEAESLKDMANRGDPELAWRALLASKYEAFVGQLVTGFNSILFAASQSAAGSASAASTLANPDVGMTFRETPSRMRLALSELDAALRAAIEAAGQDPTLAKQMREVLEIHGSGLAWLRNGALEAPEALFDAVIQRHFDSQRRKPPDGKRRWIEGERDHYSVRLRFMGERPPPADGQLAVHGYRTRAARSCFYDLSEAH